MYVFFFILVICCFLVAFSGNPNTNSKKDKNDIYNLSDCQNDLVNKNIYDKTSFDEEELEEDDYYYEDLD